MPLRMLVLLMVILVPCVDADSTCSDKLILDPTEVLEEFGGTVTVNCTSLTDSNYGMYWTNGRTHYQNESKEAFILLNLKNLSDWNARPQCIIKLNDSFECTKDLKITMYKNPEAVIVFPVNHVNALVGGTKYQLQCDIAEVAPVQNLIVKWYKDNELIMKSAFTNTIKTPVSESSILTVNISRKDNGAQFRCEAQLQFGPHGPDLPTISDTHKVSVHYPPVFTNENIDAHYVEENNNITLNCEAEGHPRPHFHWARDGVNMMEYTNNLTITKVNTNATYTCRAANSLGNVTKHIHVYVRKNTMMTPIVAITPSQASPMAACPLTLTPAALVVKVGDPASANCSTSVTDAWGIGWEVTQGGSSFQNVRTLAWTVKKLKENWTIQPKCYITLRNGQQCEVTLAITIYKPPDTVSISAIPHGPMEEGREHKLICHITNVVPVQNLKVTWYQDKKIVMTQEFNDTVMNPVNVSSILRVTPTRESSLTHFSCKAELHLGSNGPKPVPTVTSDLYTAIVYYKPLITDCPSSHIGVEHIFTLDMLACKTDGNPAPIVHWFYQAKRISVSQPFTRNLSGTYTVEALNMLGRTTNFVDIIIEYKPSFTCNNRYEIQENAWLKSTCEPEGLPAPTVTWFKDGKEFSSLHWTRNDSGEYKLWAKNTHGSATHTLTIDVLFAPAFKDGNETKIVTLGENVIFDCHAEGNPAPEILWNYTSAVNVKESTGGRHKTITITGATSTNVGVYICVATNKLRKVERSFTLLIRGQTTDLFFAVISVLFILSVVVVVVVLTRLYCRRKRGQYNFIPDKEFSGLPMTTKSGGEKS